MSTQIEYKTMEKDPRLTFSRIFHGKSEKLSLETFFFKFLLWPLHEPYLNLKKKSQAKFSRFSVENSGKRLPGNFFLCFIFNICSIFYNIFMKLNQIFIFLQKV